jgi:hypothetical protein
MTSSRRTHELASVVVALALAACNAKERAQEQSMTPVRTGPITIGLSLDRAQTSPKGPVQAQLVIQNASDAPVRLNKRLLVAYQPIIDRDVYFEVVRDGKPYVGTDEYEMSSMAKDLTADHYRAVAPGESLTKPIDLHDYYHFPSGSYRIRAVYAPQPSDAGKDAWSGTARSNEVTLTVK